MCDVKEMNRISSELLKLNPDDIQQLILEAESDEMKRFYFALNDLVLQKKQAEVIKAGVF